MDKKELLDLISGFTSEEKKIAKEALGVSEGGDNESNSEVRLKNQQDLNKASKEHLETIRQTAVLLNDMEAAREANVALMEKEIMSTFLLL